VKPWYKLPADVIANPKLLVIIVTELEHADTDLTQMAKHEAIFDASSKV